MYLGFVEDKEFGKVLIYTRRGMRRVKAEWKCGVLIMHVGAGMPLNEIMFHIENMRPRLAQLRTTAEADTLHYYDGQEIKCFRHTIKISADLLRESYAKYGSHPDGTLYVAVPAGSDFMSSGVTATISACLKRLMSTRAEQELIPFAQAVASEKGLKPRGFVVGRGMRKLGHCTADGVISLSYNLMFYPEELVRYVVCHELAHLAVFNHSKQFHNECNRLCNGLEKELEQKLRKTKLPLLK